MTHDEMIAVIQAHKEGKIIQFCNETGLWVDICSPLWNFSKYTYRVKPEKKTGWIAIYRDLSVSDVYPSELTCRESIFNNVDPACVIPIEWEE